VLKKAILLPLLLGLTILITLSGCAGRQVILHPILQTDIVRMEKDKPYTPVTDGYFLSDMYLEKVAKARLK